MPVFFLFLQALGLSCSSLKRHARGPLGFRVALNCPARNIPRDAFYLRAGQSPVSVGRQS